MKKIADVAVPERMSHLPVQNGYPVPYIVHFDEGSERAFFAINDYDKVVECIEDRKCSICGQEHDETVTFVGGWQSAWHENGAYIDPPVHRECAEYALQVCPFLAAPSWSRSIADAQARRATELSPGMMTVDNTMIPGRPEFFVGVETTGFAYKSQGYGSHVLVPDKPFVSESVWKFGLQISTWLQPKYASLMREAIMEIIEKNSEAPRAAG